MNMTTAGVQVEASFTVTNCNGVLDWPGCNRVKPYVKRENMSSCQVRGLDQIFDEIDRILSVSATQWALQLSDGVAGDVTLLAGLAPAATGGGGGDDPPGADRELRLPLDALGLPAVPHPATPRLLLVEEKERIEASSDGLEQVETATSGSISHLVTVCLCQGMSGTARESVYSSEWTTLLRPTDSLKELALTGTAAAAGTRQNCSSAGA